MLDGDSLLRAGEPRVAGQLTRAHSRGAGVHDLKSTGTVIHRDWWSSDVLGCGRLEREGPTRARMAHKPTWPYIERDHAKCGCEQAGLELARERLDRRPRRPTFERRGRWCEQEARHEQGRGEVVGIHFQASGFGGRAFDLLGAAKHQSAAVKVPMTQFMGEREPLPRQALRRIYGENTPIPHADDTSVAAIKRCISNSQPAAPSDRIQVDASWRIDSKRSKQGFRRAQSRNFCAMASKSCPSA